MTPGVAIVYSRYSRPQKKAAPTLSCEDYDRFLPFVRRTAIRIARRAGGVVSVSDLEGSGFVGLVAALEQTDPQAAPEARDAYLVYGIRGAMLDYLAGAGSDAHEASVTSRRLVQAIAELDAELEREPEEAEIAAAVGLDVEGYRRLLAKLADGGMNRLHIVLQTEADADAEEAPPEPVDVRLAGAIAALAEPLQIILALRHQEQCTPAEIAAVLDEDEQRVVELYTEAIHRLRARMSRRMA